MTTLSDISIKNSSSWNSYLNLIYPVGALYMSFTATTPASLFGGTWVQITSRFIRAANDLSTGGSDWYTLSIAELPAHKHQNNDTDWIYFQGPGNGRICIPQQWASGYGACAQSGFSASAITSVSTGGGSAHNNMPAYQDVYCWRRTA